MGLPHYWVDIQYIHVILYTYIYVIECKLVKATQFTVKESTAWKMAVNMAAFHYSSLIRESRQHTASGTAHSIYLQTELGRTRKIRWKLLKNTSSWSEMTQCHGALTPSTCPLHYRSSLTSIRHLCHFYSKEHVWIWPPRSPCPHVCATSLVNSHHPRRFLLIAFLWLMSRVRHRFLFLSNHNGNYKSARKEEEKGWEEIKFSTVLVSTAYILVDFFFSFLLMGLNKKPNTKL